MAPLIAPEIARFSINQTMAGHNIVNLWDVRINELDVGTSRADACELVAEDIVNAWCDEILPRQVNNLSFVSVSWVDLDDVDGSTGVVTTGGDETLPQSGADTTEPFPINVCALITKVAGGGGRGSRNGRLYLAGGNDAWSTTDSPINLSSGIIAALTTDFEDFSSAVSESGVAAPYQAENVVVQTRNEGTVANPDIVFVAAHNITSMVCQPVMATQRRRLRR